jgi:hypothetical protein
MEQAKDDTLCIKRLIEESHAPFFIGRIAGVELNLAKHFLKGEADDYKYHLTALESNAGIHTQDEDSVREYVHRLTAAYDHCTMIAEWEKVGKVYSFTGPGQDLITERTPTIPKISALALEPYYFEESWMEALEGKRILIVHPFVETIQKQIPHLPDLFPGRSWFKNCTFQFVAPPLTLAGNHQDKDWQEHYRACMEQFNTLEEYDIALVAAGGYGMILADDIFTKYKKSVIYIGGALQLFFGIIGKRWFDNKNILRLMTDEWVRPDPSEKPSNFTRVEKGCYW